MGLLIAKAKFNLPLSSYEKTASINLAWGKESFFVCYESYFFFKFWYYENNFYTLKEAFEKQTMNGKKCVSYGISYWESMLKS